MSLSFNYQIDEIYVGKSFLWKVYFDPNKANPVIEIGGIKYGYLDYLKRESKTLAKSEVGQLYNKGDNLYYKNETLKINIKLKRKQYSPEIDYQRHKLFEINAFNEISKLKDSLKADSYKFDWQVKDDYVFYRDNDSIPENYTPNYKKIFYNSLN